MNRSRNVKIADLLCQNLNKFCCLFLRKLAEKFGKVIIINQPKSRRQKKLEPEQQKVLAFANSSSSDLLPKIGFKFVVFLLRGVSYFASKKRLRISRFISPSALGKRQYMTITEFIVDYEKKRAMR